MLMFAQLTAIIDAMVYIKRQIEQNIDNALVRGKSVLLFGARQTGKTTLTNRIAAAANISLAQTVTRQLYERNPALLTGRIEALQQDLQKRDSNAALPLIIIDEAQKIPELFEVAQDLIDRKIAKFILTGSSARKLKHHSHLNLLPGRVVVLHLDPLTLHELPAEKKVLEDLLLFGALPGIVNLDNNDERHIDLHSYVTTYLEEEIRAEAAVRNVATFTRFLSLAAAESGKLINFQKLSQEIGVARTTIESYYQILEDCLIAEKIEPLMQLGKTNARRRLIRTPKYVFSDLGLRRMAAGEGDKPPQEHWGALFEQFVGLELLRYSKLNYGKSNVYFWRDSNGPEVDWILAKNEQLIPIEVKWTDKPTLKDAKHLQLFCAEYPNAENGYIVCRTPYKIKLADKIFALPWQDLLSIDALAD